METAMEKSTITVCDGLQESMTHMTASGKSQKEATGMKTEVLNTKTNLVFGTYGQCTKQGS